MVTVRVVLAAVVSSWVRRYHVFSVGVSLAGGRFEFPSRSESFKVDNIKNYM